MEWEGNNISDTFFGHGRNKVIFLACISPVQSDF